MLLGPAGPHVQTDVVDEERLLGLPLDFAYYVAAERLDEDIWELFDVVAKHDRPQVDCCLFMRFEVDRRVEKTGSRITPAVSLQGGCGLFGLPERGRLSNVPNVLHIRCSLLYRLPDALVDFGVPVRVLF